MTVNIAKPALNLRAELKAPPRVRRWLEQQFWFENLVANGGFDSTAAWVNASGGTGTASISGGVANLTSGGNYANRAGLEQAPTLTRRSRFLFRLTVSGETYVYGGDGSSAVKYNAGTVSHQFTTGDTTFNAGFYSQIAAAQTVDNVSLYPVDAVGAIIHPLPLGWKPLHVHEDGRLKREGAGEDYTVSFDGFRHAVKPAIAPGVATETCIIAIREGADQ